MNSKTTDQEVLVRPRLRSATLVSATIVTVLIVAALLVLAQAPLMAVLEHTVYTHPTFSILGFVAFMALWSLTTISSIPFMLLAGSLFGPWLGALWALLGMMLGTWMTYAIGRNWSAPVSHFISRHSGLQQIRTVANVRPLLTTVIVRSLMVFPLSLLRYGLPATGIAPKPYLLGSFAAILPGVILYSGLGLLIFELIHTHRVTPRAAVAVAVAALLASGLFLVVHRLRPRTRT